MKIKTVTITGADNKTSVHPMMDINEKYPFVEWGILFSKSKMGTARYPTYDWLKRLRMDAMCNGSMFTMSAHLCGAYTRELLEGKTDLFNEFTNEVGDLFSRIQLNFNSQKTPHTDKFFPLLKDLNKKYIFQFNQSNADICSEAMKELPNNVSFLYDSSGGRGTIAKAWQKPFEGFFTGYAGGLSPDNLKEQLLAIDEVTGNAEIWIDTESKVRTDEVLDMGKVKKFLEIASDKHGTPVHNFNMELADHFEKFTNDKELDIASTHDYHLCICSRGGGQPYYALLEFSPFGWVIDGDEDDDIEILAYYDLMDSPSDVLQAMKEKQMKESQ